MSLSVLLICWASYCQLPEFPNINYTPVSFHLLSHSPWNQEQDTLHRISFLPYYQHLPCLSQMQRMFLVRYLSILTTIQTCGCSRCAYYYRNCGEFLCSTVKVIPMPFLTLQVGAVSVVGVIVAGKEISYQLGGRWLIEISSYYSQKPKSSNWLQKKKIVP